MFGAKLSWCLIVRCQIVLVPNCPGAKLSGVKLSGAKLSYHPVFDCQVFSIQSHISYLSALSYFAEGGRFIANICTDINVEDFSNRSHSEKFGQIKLHSICLTS